MNVVEYFFDGASSPHTGERAGWGWVCYVNMAEYCTGYGVLERGDDTSNQAEYEALYRATLHAVAHDWPVDVNFVFVGDSQVIVGQVNGAMRVRAPHLVRKHRLVMRNLEALGEWQVRWVRREYNKRADELSRKGRTRS